MRGISLFTGIGGLDLAAEAAGIEVSVFCEIEPFAVDVLKKRFPGVQIFDDVRKLTKKTFEERMQKNETGMDLPEPIDIIFGGFPCQDLSQAGKQVGLTGARSGLWFEMLRVISELRPRYVLAENVRGAVNLALDTLYANLVAEGYKVYPYVIPASAVGAPHQRERLFVVGVREDVHRQYTEAMENPGCELRPGGSEQREMGRETSDGVCGGIISPNDTYVQKESGLFRKINRNGIDGSVRLARMVKLWPTPRQFMYKDSITDRNKGNIGEKVGGQLNPDWVEQLMNFPERWTALDVDEPKPWQGWAALLGQEQYPYEYPRTTTGCKDRAKRLKALGNAVVPAQAYPFFRAIAEIERVVKEVEG